MSDLLCGRTLYNYLCIRAARSTTWCTLSMCHTQYLMMGIFCPTWGKPGLYLWRSDGKDRTILPSYYMASYLSNGFPNWVGNYNTVVLLQRYLNNLECHISIFQLWKAQHQTPIKLYFQPSSVDRGYRGESYGYGCEGYKCRGHRCRGYKCKVV